MNREVSSCGEVARYGVYILSTCTPKAGYRAGSAQLELARYDNELAQLGSAHLAARAGSFGSRASSKKASQLAEPEPRATSKQNAYMNMVQQYKLQVSNTHTTHLQICQYI